MKKCIKCNKTYPDDVNFCPECGEKLIEENVCPKCGTPISENDKFCKSCGAKLTKEEVVEKKEEITAPIKEKKEVSKEAKDKAKMIVNIVVSAICLFAITFISSGIFGDMFSATSRLGVSTNFGTDYFLKDYPNTLGQMYDHYPNSVYYLYNLIMFIVESILYYSGIVASVILTVFAVIKNVKAIIRREAPNTKLVFAAGASMLPVMLFIASRFSVDGQELLGTRFGWGASLIITGLVFCFIAASSQKIAFAIIDRENLAPAILKTVSALLLFIFIFNAFFPLTTIKQISESSNSKVSLCGIMISETVLSSYAGSTVPYSSSAISIIFTGLSSFILSLAGVSLLFFGYKDTLKDKKTSPIVFVSISYFVLIISAVLSLVACRLYYGESGSGVTYQYNFDGGVIASLIFLQFALAGLIVSTSLVKKKAE